MKNKAFFEDYVKVIHPLDDIPEEKVDVSKLPPMPMTRAVRWSLIALRSYLVLMIILVFVKGFLLGMGSK